MRAAGRYYDAEAPSYDETRGGTARARAAASAVLSLVPGSGRCLDVGGGTGIVSAELAAAGLSVFVADVSTGMLTLARARLPGRVTAAAATRLPVRTCSVDVVSVIWLLHLLPVADADAVVAEAARVLRPGGHLVTTVDKDVARRGRITVADERERVLAVGRQHGLVPAGATRFAGRTKWEPDAEQVFDVVALRASGS